MSGINPSGVSLGRLHFSERCMQNYIDKKVDELDNRPNFINSINYATNDQITFVRNEVKELKEEFQDIKKDLQKMKKEFQNMNDKFYTMYGKLSLLELVKDKTKE